MKHPDHLQDREGKKKHGERTEKRGGKKGNKVTPERQSGCAADLRLDSSAPLRNGLYFTAMWCL